MMFLMPKTSLSTVIWTNRCQSLSLQPSLVGYMQFGGLAMWIHYILTYPKLYNQDDIFSIITSIVNIFFLIYICFLNKIKWNILVIGKQDVYKHFSNNINKNYFCSVLTIFTFYFKFKNLVPLFSLIFFTYCLDCLFSSI